MESEKTVYDEIVIPDKFEMIHKAFANTGKNIATIDFNKLQNTVSSYTKEQLQSALQSKSEANTKILIEASNYFYTYSGEYRQLIHRFAGIHKYRNVIYPRFQFDKKANVQKIHDKVGEYILNSRVEETCLNIAIKALLDGTSYTYEIVKDNNYTQQFLPSDYCRTRTFDEYGNKVVEFNFRYFDEKYSDNNQKELVFKQLPSEFKTLYNAYKAGKNNIGDTKNHNWQQLDTNMARATTFSLDGTPYFCAIFPDLLDYVNYKMLNKLSSELDLFTILIQKAEFDQKTGEMLVDDATMDVLSNTLAQIAKTGGCGAFTTPFSVEALKMRDKNETKQDYVQMGLTGVYNSASLPEIAFNSSSKNGGTVGLKSSNEMTEGIFDTILGQFKNWYFKKLNEVSTGKVVFDIDFLPITCFNEKDKITIYKEQFTFGGSMFYYFASMGINQFEIASLLSYENGLKVKDLLIVPQSSYTQTGDINKGQAGKPNKDDGDVTDTTLTQRDNGIDKSRTVV